MDSNKRLALLCAHVLVRLNGHRLGLSKDAAFTLLSEWVASELDDIRAIATVLEIRPEASA